MDIKNPNADCAMSVFMQLGTINCIGVLFRQGNVFTQAIKSNASEKGGGDEY